MRKLDYYWQTNKDWYYTKENGVCVIKDTAPPEAQESYKRYREQVKYATKRIKEGYSCD